MIVTYNLSKEYEMGSNTVHALRDVNLQIPPDSFIALVGKSGSGKSTLLNILGGLDSATSGDVVINDKKITRMNEKELSVFRRKHVGFVFQFFNLVSELNIYENIIFPALLDKSDVDRDYYNKLIDILELRDRLNHLPSQLSGGQQQRVAIARALILKPQFVLLDEPTGNLDEVSSCTVIDMLCKIRRELGQTMIIVTHDLDIAHKADRIINIKDGTLC